MKPNVGSFFSYKPRLKTLTLHEIKTNGCYCHTEMARSEGSDPHFAVLPRQFRGEKQHDEVAEERDKEGDNKVGTVGNQPHQQETAAADGRHHQQGSRAFLKVSEAV